jgi:alpha-tubulin suppressor-like RCC1 family protein
MSTHTETLKASLEVIRDALSTLRVDVLAAESEAATLLGLNPNDDDEADDDTKTGFVLCWGRADFLPAGAFAVPPAVNSDVVAIACGLSNQAIALKSNHELITWTINPANADVPNASISNTEHTPIRAIAAGYDHFMALTQSGEVLAWGGNGEGQCIVPDEAKTGIVAIAAAHEASVALTYTGEVIVWGRSEASLQGVGLATIPDAAKSGIIAIDCSASLITALTNTGRVVVWGWASHGQTVPPFSTQDGVVAVAAGRQHCLALKDTGQLVAWGNSDEAFVSAVNASGLMTNGKKLIASEYDSALLTHDGILTVFTQSYGAFQSAPFVNGQQNVLDFDSTSTYCLALVTP